MYIKPYISDIVRLGVNIESVSYDCVYLRHINDTFITIHNKNGFLVSVSIEYPSRKGVTLPTTSHNEAIDFISKHLEEPEIIKWK